MQPNGAYTFQVLTQMVPALRPRERVLTTLMSFANTPAASPQAFSLARCITCTHLHPQKASMGSKSAGFRSVVPVRLLQLHQHRAAGGPEGSTGRVHLPPQ